jgi:hypothetical protein
MTGKDSYRELLTLKRIPLLLCSLQARSLFAKTREVL